MSIECELHVSTPYEFLHPYTEEKAVTIRTLKNIYSHKEGTKDQAVTMQTQ